MLTARLELPAWRYGNARGDRAITTRSCSRGCARTPAIENAALVDRLPLLDGEPIDRRVDRRTRAGARRRIARGP